jgi:prolyl-tRNA synthetase
MNRKEKMYDEIRKHGENLNAIFNTGLDPVALCKKLHRLENKAHGIETKECNGDYNEMPYDDETGEIIYVREQEDKILNSLDKILNFRKLGIPVFINGDARGYTLKIKSKYVADNQITIYQDWGGYGIIAPDFGGRE